MTFWVNMHKFLFLVALLLTVPILITILRPGFFPVHDDFSPIRILEIDKCVKDGQLPCRWSPDMGFGYGYPEFNYYAPLPYYVMEGFHLLGAGYLDSVKIFIVLISLISAAGMFLLASTLWGDIGGLVSTIIYIYLPYRAVDIYVRGAMGELVVFAILPFLFWAARGVAVGKKKNFVWLVIFLFILFTSHNIGAVIVVPALVLWFASMGKIRKVILFLLALFWGFSLSAFFLIPAWFEKNLVHIDTLTSGYFNYLAHFLDIKQILFSMHWGYGVSQLGPNDDINLSIGIVQWVLPALGLLLVLFALMKHKFVIKNLFHNINLQFVVLILIGLVSLFLTHSKSTFIWDGIAFMKYIQFPWRFLLLAGFSFSLAGGYLFKFFGKGKYVGLLVVLLFVVSYLLYGGFFKPKEWLFINDTEKFSGQNWIKEITASIYDYLPAAAKKAPDFEAKKEPVFVGGGGVILGGKKGTNWQDWDVKVDSTTANLQLQVYDFPNWQVLVDGEKSAINSDNKHGLITVSLASGNHKISGKLMDTPIRTISNVISLAALAIFSFLCLKRYFC